MAVTCPWSKSYQHKQWALIIKIFLYYKSNSTKVFELNILLIYVSSLMIGWDINLWNIFRLERNLKRPI